MLLTDKKFIVDKISSYISHNTHLLHSGKYGDELDSLPMMARHVFKNHYGRYPNLAEGELIIDYLLFEIVSFI
jgi:hypothetical protein